MGPRCWAQQQVWNTQSVSLNIIEKTWKKTTASHKESNYWSQNKLSTFQSVLPPPKSVTLFNPPWPSSPSFTFLEESRTDNRDKEASALLITIPGHDNKPWAVHISGKRFKLFVCPPEVFRLQVTSHRLNNPPPTPHHPILMFVNFKQFKIICSS